MKAVWAWVNTDPVKRFVEDWLKFAGVTQVADWSAESVSFPAVPKLVAAFAVASVTVVWRWAVTRKS